MEKMSPDWNSLLESIRANSQMKLRAPGSERIVLQTEAKILVGLELGEGDEQALVVGEEEIGLERNVFFAFHGVGQRAFSVHVADEETFILAGGLADDVERKNLAGGRDGDAVVQQGVDELMVDAGQRIGAGIDDGAEGVGDADLQRTMRATRLAAADVSQDFAQLGAFFRGVIRGLPDGDGAEVEEAHAKSMASSTALAMLR
jgi:hypothetical protein